MFLSICGLSILIICLVALNTELVFLEALKKWFVHLSSKWLFCKKAQTHENLLLHCKLFISLEKIFSCTWALLLKLHLVTSHWERCFEHLWPQHSHNLLSSLNTELCLRSSKSDFVHLSSKLLFLQKKLKLMKICLLHCKKLFISLERISCTWAFLKIFSNFLTEKRFWASVASAFS